MESSPAERRVAITLSAYPTRGSVMKRWIAPMARMRRAVMVRGRFCWADRLGLEFTTCKCDNDS